MPYRTADELVDMIMLDCWPRGVAAQVDFGIDSQKVYEAYYDPIRAGELTANQLHEAAGDGPKLTALLRACTKNRHKDVEIRTLYDSLGDE